MYSVAIVPGGDITTEDGKNLNPVAKYLCYLELEIWRKVAPWRGSLFVKVLILNLLGC